MTEIVPHIRVRRCTLTIRRRDGWSWGAGSEPHVRAALASVEAALAAAVAEAGVAPGADAVLSAPVRLELGADGRVTHASIAPLVEALRAVPTAAIPAVPASAPATATEPMRGHEGAASQDAGTSPAEHGAAALARTLGRWSRTGRLDQVVRAWPSELVRTWIAAVAAAGGDTGHGAEPASMPSEAVAQIAAAVLDKPPGGAAGRSDEPARLLVLLAALTAALGDRISDPATQALAAQCALGATVAPRAAGEPKAAPADRSHDGTAAVRPRTPSASPAIEVVVPALGLLVLAELARIGYTDALMAAADVADLRDGAGALSAAIAAKVLPLGVERSKALGVAFGGPAELVPDALETLAAHEHVLAPSLAAWLLTAYAEARSAKEEVIVTGCVCGEQRGLLPAAWVSREDELDAVLAALGHPPVRRDDAFAPLAEALAARPGVPAAPALERHLGAAAGTALGLLALDLWGAEATSLLALERFDDLEARVRVSPDGVLASIPRGQRWLDLQAAGRLGVVALPWLAGGRLEVGTW